jgi:hypothetical protein
MSREEIVASIQSGLRVDRAIVLPEMLLRQKRSLISLGIAVMPPPTSTRVTGRSRGGIASGIPAVAHRDGSCHLDHDEAMIVPVERGQVTRQ